MQRPAHEVPELFVEPELLRQPFHERPAAAGDELNADRLAVTPLQELLLDALHEVFGVVVLDRKIHVARNAERKILFDSAAGEQRAEVVHDQLFEQHEAAAGLVVRHLDEARQELRNLDEGVYEFAAPGRTHADGNLDRSRIQDRERMGRIDRERRQDRQHLPAEIARQLRAHGCGDIGRPDQLHAAAPELRQDFIHQAVVLPLEQPVKFLPHPRELFGGAVPGRVRQILPHLDQLPQPGDPHHEKLVEVAAEDRDELQPFEHRVCCASGLVQHPRVEINPRKFAADEEPAVRGITVFLLYLLHDISGVSSIFKSKPNTSLNIPPFSSR